MEDEEVEKLAKAGRKRKKVLYLSPYKSRQKTFYRNEAILYMPRERNSYYFFGIGMIRQVDENVVLMTFGKRSKYKKDFVKIKVEQLMAKKQLCTLKRGQFCQVYGINYNMFEGHFEALAFFPAYVPIKYDRERIERENAEIEQPSDEELDILERFM